MVRVAMFRFWEKMTISPLVSPVLWRLCIRRYPVPNFAVSAACGNYGTRNYGWHYARVAIGRLRLLRLLWLFRHHSGVALEFPEAPLFREFQGNIYCNLVPGVQAPRRRPEPP